MRAIFALFAVAALLVAPVALAGSGASEPRGDKGRAIADEHRADDHRADKANWTARGNGTSANHTRGNHTDDDDANGTRAEGRPAWVEHMLGLRLAWREDASAVREECRALAQPDGNNTTKEDKLERAQCVRDGYKSLLDAFREQLREIRLRMRHAAE